MPEAVTFRVFTYFRLAKGETGLTQMSTQRVPASLALDWVLNELPEDAVTISYSGDEDEVSTTVIDWSKVPDSIRNPEPPARRR